MSLGTKPCAGCGSVLSLSLFHKDSRAKDGRRSRCAACVAQTSRANSRKDPVMNPSVTHKVCRRCERLGKEALLPIDEFGIAKRMVDGKYSWCKGCCSEVSGAWLRSESGRRKHIEAVKRYRERQKLEYGRYS